MKFIVTSFLFFCISLVVVHQSAAQSTDSLNHYSRLVNNPKNPEDLAKAFTFFNKKKNIHSKDKKDITHEIYATQNLAEIQKKLGYTAENERLNLESLKLLEQIEDKTDWTQISYLRIINELGKIYRERKDYSQALKLYDEALSKANSANHKAVLLNNKGKVYESREDLETAITFYEDSYQKAIETNHSNDIARALSNKSFAQSQLGIAQAEKGLKQALQLRLSSNNKYELGSSYNHLARHYYHKNDTKTAKNYSDEFLRLANTTNVAEQLQSALKLKIETGEPEYAIEYIALNDSLNNLKEQRRNHFNYYVYQYDKKEKDLQKSQLFNERLIFLLLFIALASIALYFILKYKHKKEKLQEVYNTETRISRTIHDEVANDVYHVMTQLQTGSNDSKELLDHLESIYKRTRDISKQNSSIDLDIPFTDLLNDLLLSYRNNHVNVISKGLQSIKWDDFNDLEKATIYRVLQELFTNMKKHSEASIVVLSFAQLGKSLIITYKDNGTGTSLIKGNGLQNTVTRIHSINGTITFESEIEKGFKATITI